MAMQEVQNSTSPSVRGDEDPLSPTTIVLNYLKQRGIQPTAANVRDAVRQMGRQPTTSGPDVTSARIQELPDSVAGAIEGGGAPGGGQRQGSRGGSSGGRQRTGATPPMDRRTDATSPTTSASPNDPLGPIILAGGGPAAIGYGMYRYFNRMPPEGGAAAGGGRALATPASEAEYIGRGAVPPTGRTMDVPSAEQIAGGQFDLLPGGQSQETAFDRAMGRAVQPQVGLGQRGLLGSDAVNLSGVKPVVQPSDVTGARPIPGVGDLDLSNAATGRDFANMPAIGSPVLNPGEGAVFPDRPRITPPAELAPSGDDLLAGFMRLFGGRR